MARKQSRFIIGRVAVAAMTLAMATSCLWEGTLFHSYHTFSLEEGWSRQDTLVYELPAIAPETPCGIAVNVRYMTDFPYKQLGVVVRHNMADSATWKCDTLLCPLFDEQGLPCGNGTLDLYQVEAKTKIDGEPLWVTTDTTARERLTVQLLHCMTDDKVVGIRDVGVRVYK